MTYHHYEWLKAFWLRANPDASPAQYEAACQRLAALLEV